jgi:mRNA-degrading endonuclease RelE of RelBE toxin-antitoxin system
VFRVLNTSEFEKDLARLPNPERIRVCKILWQLKEHGADVGKPLSGLSFFREKKFNGRRLYFLVYKDLPIVLTLAISDKKAQKATINRILLDLVEYQQYIHKLAKKS